MGKAKLREVLRRWRTSRGSTRLKRAREPWVRWLPDWAVVLVAGAALATGALLVWRYVREDLSLDPLQPLRSPHIDGPEHVRKLREMERQKEQREDGR